MDLVDTIAAPITAPGQAAISCVRLCGPQTREVLKSLIEKHQQVLARPREQIYTIVYDLIDGDEPLPLDHALVSFFVAPHSFTGEDTVEFQLHGSPFVVQRLLENLYRQGVRQAQPGEFSKRAFLNGRMDLSQAEGVADLIAAETEAQARVAEQQLAGRLSAAVNKLGEPLRDLLAEIEAFIDFPEEGIEPLEKKKWLARLKPVLESTRTYVNSYRTGKVYRDGAKVVLTGVPNAGKSSLLNALVGESRAIVTALPGTTRDSIEQRIDLSGLAVNLWDTAGLVESGAERDEVEKIGIERSWKLLDEADLVVFVFGPDVDQSQQSRFFSQIVKRSSRIMVLINKRDLMDTPRQQQMITQITQLYGERPLILSAQTHDGLEELQEEIYQRLIGAADLRGSLLICNRRHFEALSLGAEALERAEVLLQQDNIEPEFVALELRATLGALQEIVGVTHTEDILGRIFSKFCIGK